MPVDQDKMGRFLWQSLNRFSIEDIWKVFAWTRSGLVEETKAEFEGSTHFLRLSCRHRWGFEPRFHVTHQTQSTIFQRFGCVMTYNKTTEVQIQCISWLRIFLQDEYFTTYTNLYDSHVQFSTNCHTDDQNGACGWFRSFFPTSFIPRLPEGTFHSEACLQQNNQHGRQVVISVILWAGRKYNAILPYFSCLLLHIGFCQSHGISGYY